MNETDAHSLLEQGLTALSAGDAQTAARHLELAVSLYANQPEFHLNYGVALERLGRLDEAEEQFRAALTLGESNASFQAPFQAKAAANLGFVLRRKGDFQNALGAFDRALELDPGHIGAGLGFVHLLGGLRAPEYSPGLEAALLRGLGLSHANYADLAGASAHQLSLKYGLPDAEPQPDALATDPLFAAYLEKCLNTDPGLEMFLTGLRKRLVLTPPEDLNEDAQVVAALLAGQCFLNEYVFLAEDDETAAVAALKDRLESLLETSPDDAAFRPAAILYALYQPFSTLSGAENLAALSGDALGSALDGLVDLTLRHALQEKGILENLETLRPITDGTSKAVAAMYEENPYPRWLHVPAQQATPLSEYLGGLFRHFTPPDFGDRLDILIAGCGTGQHVAHAARTHPKASITAVDLSGASLAYAARMMENLGIENVKFLQADILDLGDLGRDFDMIQSVGVLHHMKQPGAGWQVLAGLLRPGGVFKAGLYSARGRESITACRRIIEEEAIGSTRADIAAFRRRILTADPGGKDGALTDVIEVRDFFTTSMCRDLLFHVQELNTSPSGLKATLDAAGLDFIGFEGFEDAGINAAYRETFPNDPALTDLDNWQAFEAEHGALTDMYVFWCHKPD